MTRPHPLAALEIKHRMQAERLAKRGDRFSQLMSRVLEDEHRGQYLVTNGALSAEEYDELRRIRPTAHEGFRLELQAAIDRLREPLRSGDALYITAVVRYFNMVSDWGEYYEPTHEGSEAKVELICGLLATQPTAEKSQHPSPGGVWAGRLRSRVVL